jgi:hypothetical protein
MLRAFLTSSLALTVVAVAAPAWAAEPDPQETPEPDAPEPRAKSHDDLLLTAGLGGFGDDHKTGGVLSFTALRQKGLLGYGATFEYGSAFLDYTSVTAAPIVGIFVDGPSYLRLGLAAAGGIHHYEGVDGAFIFSSDPGASGTTPFIGARAIAGAEFGGKARFHLGLQLSLDDDLTRTRTPYTYEEKVWSSPYSVTTSHTVGSLRVGAMLALGTAFDL